MAVNTKLRSNKGWGDYFPPQGEGGCPIDNEGSEMGGKENTVA